MDIPTPAWPSPLQRWAVRAQGVFAGNCCAAKGKALQLSSTQREALGYLQEPLVNEDLNGDNCISTKAISYFSPISAVLNRQPGPCL